MAGYFTAFPITIGATPPRSVVATRPIAEGRVERAVEGAVCAPRHKRCATTMCYRVEEALCGAVSDARNDNPPERTIRFRFVPWKVALGASLGTRSRNAMNTLERGVHRDWLKNTLGATW